MSSNIPTKHTKSLRGFGFFFDKSIPNLTDLLSFVTTFGGRFLECEEQLKEDKTFYIHPAKPKCPPIHSKHPHVPELVFHLAMEGSLEESELNQYRSTVFSPKRFTTLLKKDISIDILDVPEYWIVPDDKKGNSHLEEVSRIIIQEGCALVATTQNLGGNERESESLCSVFLQALIKVFKDTNAHGESLLFFPQPQGKIDYVVGYQNKQVKILPIRAVLEAKSPVDFVEDESITQCACEILACRSKDKENYALYGILSDGFRIKFFVSDKSEPKGSKVIGSPVFSIFKPNIYEGKLEKGEDFDYVMSILTHMVLPSFGCEVIKKAVLMREALKKEQHSHNITKLALERYKQILKELQTRLAMKRTRDDMSLSGVNFLQKE